MSLMLYDEFVFSRVFFVFEDARRAACLILGDFLLVRFASFYYAQPVSVVPVGLLCVYFFYVVVEELRALSR